MKQVYKAPGKKRRFSATAVCLLLTAVLAIGGTVAYLFTSSATVTNTFNPVTNTNEITEELNGNVKENVKIKNTGSTDSYIRAKVIITWQDENNNVYPQLPQKDTDYTITAGSNKWKEYNGYYYYADIVAPGAYTENLIGSITPVTANVPEGYELHVEILAQSIQSTPDTAVQEAWGVTISSSGVTAAPTT
ncbi:MAG: hypothetical protein IJ410_01535 [Oscillospiraceae bacterium]|nr:hypothetical protein [Oscillospiraceae bacterium]